MQTQDHTPSSDEEMDGDSEVSATVQTACSTLSPTPLIMLLLIITKGMCYLVVSIHVQCSIIHLQLYLYPWPNLTMTAVIDKGLLQVAMVTNWQL